MADTSSPTGRMTQRDLIRHLLADGSVRRSATLLAEGVRPSALADALETGVVVRAAPGAYHLASSACPPALLAIATACTRATGALVCLTTAAHLCGLLDEPEDIVWIARPVGARVPKRGTAREQVVHWRNPGAFEVGVVQDVVCGVEVRRTDPARTVVDVFRYARYVGGEETALRIGSRFLRQGGDPASVLVTAQAVGTPRKTLSALGAFLDAGSGSSSF